MKYYLVALFDNDSYKHITPMQRNLSKRFKANRNSPMPHVLLEVLDNPNVEKLDVIIEKILKPYKNFKIEVCDKVLVSENNRTVNIKIQDVGYIKRLSRIIKDTLKLHNFNTKNYTINSNAGISLANLNYIPKENKYNDIYRSDINTLKVNRIELWKVSNNRRETIIKSYPFKEF